MPFGPQNYSLYYKFLNLVLLLFDEVSTAMAFIGILSILCNSVWQILYLHCFSRCISFYCETFMVISFMSHSYC